MTDKELMQQALEALDYEAERGNDDAYKPIREALRERLAQPAQQPLKPLTDEQQIAEALRRHGLTLVKTATGYDVMNLGQITAHSITGEKE